MLGAGSITTNPNRTVAVLTPLLFAPAAGSVSALAAKYGLDVDGGSLQAIFIAGATIAFAKAGLWMKGWQDFEKRQEAQHVDPLDMTGEPDFAPELDGEEELDVADLAADDIDDEDFLAEAEELLAGQRG